jgi:hypothetical protein
MRSDTEPTAPIGRVFTSVEGESTRIGEVTSFVHIADGVHETARNALMKIGPRGLLGGHGATLVLDPCEATYFNWCRFADDFIHKAREYGWKKIILETRGERVFDWMEVPLYLHLTPGLTVLKPRDLVPGRDEVKLLVNHEKEVREAMELLAPFAKRGIPSFVLPRVGSAIWRAKLCFGYFLTTPNPHGVRMMLIEHEVTGIE